MSSCQVTDECGMTVTSVIILEEKGIWLSGSH